MMLAEKIIYWSSFPIYAIILAFTILYSLNIYMYLVKDDWGFLIPDLGSSFTGKILMSIHFITGIICMSGYPIQKTLVLCDKVDIFHIVIGILLNICTFITGMMGVSYILIHGTIGGLVMDIAFSIYGILVAFWGIISCFISCKLYLYSNPEDLLVQIYEKKDKKKIRKLHYHMSNIYAALIYGSYFYRILNVVAKYSGYPVPNRIHTDRYFRPLDQFFQFAFYLIPLLCIILYGLCVHYKYTKTRALLKLVLLCVMTFTLVIVIQNILKVF